MIIDYVLAIPQRGKRLKKSYFGLCAQTFCQLGRTVFELRLSTNSTLLSHIQLYGYKNIRIGIFITLFALQGLFPIPLA